MTECLGESDVKELAHAALAEFDQAAAAVPQDLCAPFNAVASRLEGQLLTIYRTVVQIVRREDDLEKIAHWWAMMVSQCDEFAKKLQDLEEAHPACGAGIFYDRVLDLRNKCHRLQEMHC